MVNFTEGQAEQFDALFEHFKVTKEDEKFIMGKFTELAKLSAEEIKIFSDISDKIDHGFARGAFICFLFGLIRALSIGKEFYATSLITEIIADNEGISIPHAIEKAKKEIDKKFPQGKKDSINIAYR